MEKEILTSVLAEDQKLSGPKAQIVSDPMPKESIEQRDRKISELNTLLETVTSIGDIEKRYPGITELYDSIRTNRRKLRNLKKKQRKQVKSLNLLKSLSPKSYDFTPKLMEHYKLNKTDLCRSLVKYEGLVGRSLEDANFVNRGIIEESVILKQKGEKPLDLE